MALLSFLSVAVQELHLGARRASNVQKKVFSITDKAIRAASLDVSKPLLGLRCVTTKDARISAVYPGHDAEEKVVLGGGGGDRHLGPTLDEPSPAMGVPAKCNRTGKPRSEHCGEECHQSTGFACC